MRSLAVMEIDRLLSEAIRVSEEALPRVGQSPAMFAGRTFHYGVEAPDRRGVYLLFFEYQNRSYPLYVGDGWSIRSAITDTLAEREALRRLTHGFYWAPAASEADGRQLAEYLIAVLQPHFNEIETGVRAKADSKTRARSSDPRLCLRSISCDDPGQVVACRRHSRILAAKPVRHAPARPASRSKRQAY